MSSAALGLAVASGMLDPATAFNGFNLDELFQAERWGENAPAAARRAHAGADLRVHPETA